MRPILLLLMMMLLAGVALFFVQGNRSASPSRPVGDFDLELTLFPPAPTSADLVEIRLGGGSEAPEQALRVAGSNRFFVEVQEVPAQATYTLGALAPGEYTFSLFRQISGIPSCRHELLGELTFTVKPAGRRGSGRLALLLLLKGGDREGARALVERENPQVDWLLGNVAVLRFTPGLEESYQELLRERPEVEAVELNSVGFIPECPPPLGPAVAPGSLLVSFKEGMERERAERLVRQLPPQLEAFQRFRLLLWELSLASARVRVPSGWEQFFLRRYLKQQEVLFGRVLPPSAKSAGEGE